MKKVRNIFLGIALIMGMQSCFGLTEEVFSDMDKNIYYQDEESVKGIIAEIYYCSFNKYNDSFWYLQEFSADQINWRSWNNGLWGYSEGKRLVISTQNWTPEATLIKDAWENAWETIGLCNSALEDFEELDLESMNMTADKLEEYKAEVRTMRAWDYYRIYEIWGGALPLTTTTVVGTELPSSADPDFDKGCKVIYDFLIQELDESLDALPLKSVNRANKAMNRMLKARLLLNAEVFIKESRFNECKLLCQEILDGKYGNYSVASDYRSLFAVDNHTCEEVVMAFACDASHMNASNLRVMPFVPYNISEYTTPFNVDGSPWNSTCLAPSYDNSASIYDGGQPKCFLDPPYNDKLGAIYERFHDKDIRKGNYMFDFATNTWSGIFLNGEMRANYGTGDFLEADADREGQPLIFVDQVGPFAVQGQGTSRDVEDVMSPRWGETNSGVRLVKYPILPSSSGMDFREPDEVEFRISEVIFMLAECEMREGDSDGAKELANSVRQRYFSSQDWAIIKDQPGRIHSGFDMDWMLDQWGQEFIGEGYRRRTDLRRFDKFTQGQWWFFGRANDDGFNYPAKRDRKYEWFPLPAIALSSNPNLTQNPNY